MNAVEIRKNDKKYNLHSWSAQGDLDPIVVDRAEGIYFWDSDGKKYYDMSSQLVNMNIGHGNEKVKEAIKNQVDKLSYIAPPYAIDVRSELARKIIEEIAPDNMGKVFFTTGGADANENAIKIARMYTGRYKVMSRYRSYHGSTYAAANATGEPRRFPSEPGIPGFIKFFDPYIYREFTKFDSEEAAADFYLNKLREQIIYEGRDQIAAVIIETVTGSNGVIIPPAGYLKGIRKICDDYGIMMICDEVMTGFGRTGEWFACQNWGVEPDIITFAKGITCGYVPLGGVIVSKKIAEYFDTNPLICGLTYSAHPVGCAAGIATIDVYKELNLLENTKKMSVVLKRELLGIAERHPCMGEIRVIGLFGMFELNKNPETNEAIVPYGIDPEKVMARIVKKLKNEGFSTYSHENLISVSPPLIINEEEIKEALEILDRVLSWVDDTFLTA
ncbi:MAG: aminotransferase class III-fold pyridoxal phosphate-dependent enzyme [Spirochaetales bacterium]|nr:aminotransferase class III-fold pyridoxal phosphate-dependent enzyme [Spirochaetales bacterium]